MSIQSIPVAWFILGLSLLGCTPGQQGYSRKQTTGSTQPAVTNQGSVLDDDSDEEDDDFSSDGSKKKPSQGDDGAGASQGGPNYCGSMGIVGGTVATMNDMVVKSTVRLIIGQGSCTGAIIGPNQISTAAHCLEGNPAVSSITIEFGIQPQADPNVRVKGYSVHPDYNGLNIGPNGYPQERLYDVAVIAFDGKIPQGFGIAPVGSTAKLQAGVEVTLAGYGAYSDNDMQERPLSLVKKPVALFDRNLKEIQLEVGGAKGGCYGDSGGPSYIQSENGMCLYTLSTTTGPGRASNGSCTQGSGTLMDITAHQGWMSCAFEKLGSPLAYLLKDDSKEACDRTMAVQ